MLVNTAISATFSEAMNAPTINAATFTVTGPGATPVAGVVTYTASTATFTPAAILANSILFTATITTGAKDPAGAALAANFVWTFTTAPPPTVVSTVPADGATAVPVNTLISATFSEAMNAATIRYFLAEHGVPADHTETRSFGEEDQLTAEQIKEQIVQNPDLTPDDRQQMLNNLRVMVLANNRRVDVTLSTTGQQSTHRYPFNARDYLALISTKGGEKEPRAKKKH